VLDVRTRVAQQRAQHRGVLGGRREVALVDAVTRRGNHGRLEQIGVGVSEEIGADPADEIEHGAPVGEPHARAASARRGDRGDRERSPAQPRDLAQRALVGLRRDVALGGRRAHRLDQRLCRLPHAGRVGERPQRMSLRAGHRKERIGLPELGLAGSRGPPKNSDRRVLARIRDHLSTSLAFGSLRAPLRGACAQVLRRS
jgi:hypothetical protein